MDFGRQRTFILWVTVLVLIRMVLGLWAVFHIMPVSIDDYFRVFHAWWWWEHPSFASSFVWLPGYQYAYGPIIGWTGDTVLAPRFLTLGLHLLTGIVVASIHGALPCRRIVALALLYFSPLSIPLGTAPFAESLTFFLLTLHWFFLDRMEKSNSITMLFGGSVMLMMASAVRYEVWLLIPVYILGLRRFSPDDASRIGKWIGLLPPLFFPVAWILRGCANRDGCFAFLAGTTADHLGTGSVVDMLTSFWGMASLIQLVILTVAIAKRWRSETSLAPRLLSVYLLLSLVLVVGLVVTRALPSQLTERVLSMPVIVAVLCWSLHKPSLNPRWILGIVIPVVLLGTVALGHLLLRPPGIQPSNYATAEWVNAQFQSGELSANDYVVISKHLPDSAAILILSNQIDNIHIDSLRRECTLEFLTPYAPTCELPDWAAQVRVVITWRNGRESTYMKALAWKKEAVNDNWIIWRRPPGAAFPVRNRALHPLLRQSNDLPIAPPAEQ